MFCALIVCLVNRFIDDASEELEYANSLYLSNGRTDIVVDVAAITDCDTGSEPETITFCGESSELEATLFDADRWFSNNFSNVYGTVGIHDYVSYLNLTHDYSINDPDSECGVNYAWRALYAWQIELIDDAYWPDFLQFCHDYCINKIYLEAQSLTYHSYYHYNLSRFLNNTFDYGIEVELVLGYKKWALRKNHQECLTFVSAVIEYIGSLGLVEENTNNNDYSTTTNDGTAPEIDTEYYVLQIPNVLHLDIEPTLL